MTAHYDYKFRKASLLDIPFIFGLIQEDSLNGFLDESLITSKGYIFILVEMFLHVLQPLRIMPRGGSSKLLIFTLNNEDIGFIKIKSQFTSEHIQVIGLCSIDPDHRNHKHGSQMIRMYIETLPIGTEVIAYCSKYARAMQPVLKTLKFRRDKNSFPNECYRYTKNPDTPHMNSGINSGKQTPPSAQIYLFGHTLIKYGCSSHN